MMKLQALILAMLITLPLLAACGGGSSERPEDLSEGVNMEELEMAADTLARCGSMEEPGCSEARDVIVSACVLLMTLEYEEADAATIRGFCEAIVEVGQGITIFEGSIGD